MNGCYVKMKSTFSFLSVIDRSHRLLYQWVNHLLKCVLLLLEQLKRREKYKRLGNRIPFFSLFEKNSKIAYNREDKNQVKRVKDESISI